jgi:2,5-diketo-D-gluconate reductase A
MSTLAPTLPLVNGARIPALGLGTWPLDDAGAEKAVATAVEHGYRLVDTAESYGNERGVGRGLRASGVPRGELFVTTKFERRWHSVDGVRQVFEQSVERLGLDHLDLLLVHWPNPDQGATSRRSRASWPCCGRASCGRPGCPTSPRSTCGG